MASSSSSPKQQLAAACLALLVAVVAMASPCAAQNSPQDYVDLHNAARDGEGVGLGPVFWDDNLAEYAEGYAAQRQGDCELVHSGGPYGENLFRGGAGKDWSASDAVDGSWMAEKQFYDLGSNTCAEGEMCGHYTQIVWRDTTAIGCARVVCDSGAIFIICSYNPPGNVNGGPPYQLPAVSSS